MSRWKRTGRSGSLVLKRGYVLVIAEKTRAASKIAQALGLRFGGKKYGVPFWEGYFNGRYYVVAPAAGHLFSLRSNERDYPVFSYEWVPRWMSERNAEHTKRYYMALQELAKSASLFINACDFDIEGSVIGYLIIKMFGNVNKALRVKFSSLTLEELREALKRPLPSLDWDMIEAGLCRHELDWIWGINVSRALMDIYRLLTGKKLTLSAGRVQSPTLLEALNRYIARETFIPSVSFNITLYIEVNGETYKLEQVSPPFRRYEEARKIANMLKGIGYIEVVSTEQTIRKLNPPPPFNLPDLQVEASRVLGISPSETLKLAEDLYLDSLISYPRTNSQKLPPTLNNRKIIENLGRLSNYRVYANELLKREVLKPTLGTKDDPAHPAIYPTGYLPTHELRGKKKQLYDLIVRRYLACFYGPALIKSTSYTFKFKSLTFALSGQKIIKSEWLRVYPYVSVNEASMPHLHKGEKVRIAKVRISKAYSRPPPPHTKTTLLKWMEKVGIGTEATRADIIETLFKRGYLKKSGKATVVTELGVMVARILSKLFSELTSVNLTREFEQALALVRLGKISRTEVVSRAKEVLRPRLMMIKDIVRSNNAEKLRELIEEGEGKSKCLICGEICAYSPVAGSDICFCEFHSTAYKHIIDKYREWREALGLSFTEYLKELLRIKSTGKFVKEVASAIISRSELLRYIKDTS
ncbi:MAG: DNA topoisomerase I [Desulfurococcales archaeon]|nr:DNA topoisomerase I [Desulfurococcales archaeon]